MALVTGTEYRPSRDFWYPQPFILCHFSHPILISRSKFSPFGISFNFSIFSIFPIFFQLFFFKMIFFSFQIIFRNNTNIFKPTSSLLPIVHPIALLFSCTDHGTLLNTPCVRRRQHKPSDEMPHTDERVSHALVSVREVWTPRLVRMTPRNSSGGGPIAVAIAPACDGQWLFVSSKRWC